MHKTQAGEIEKTEDLIRRHFLQGFKLVLAFDKSTKKLRY